MLGVVLVGTGSVEAQETWNWRTRIAPGRSIEIQGVKSASTICEMLTTALNSAFRTSAQSVQSGYIAPTRAVVVTLEASRADNALG